LFVEAKDLSSYYTESIVLNKGAIGKDFKKDRLKVEKEIMALDPKVLREKLAKGKLVLEKVDKLCEISSEHVQVMISGKAPYVVKILSYGTAILNGEINPDLAQEGFARDLIRNVQTIRKSLNLSRNKECIKINAPDKDLDIKKELGKFIDMVKNETRCLDFGDQATGTECTIELGDRTVRIFIEVAKGT